MRLSKRVPISSLTPLCRRKTAPSLLRMEVIDLQPADNATANLGGSMPLPYNGLT